jgi:hypothetical protein
MYKWIIVTCLIIIAIYLNVKQNKSFWSIQPVFHVNDIHYWIYPIGLIQSNLGDKNIYVDTEHVTTIDTCECMSDLFDEVALFIKDHFLKSDEFFYAPSGDDLSNTLHTYERHSSYISVYRNDSGLCSVITSTSYDIWIDDTRQSINYVDHLCVRTDIRNKLIAPKSISTLIYNMCHQHNPTNIILFKREEVLTGIVPLTVFNISSYLIDEISKVSTKMSHDYTINLIDPKDILSVVTFIHTYVTPRVKVSVMPSIDKMKYLIEKDLYKIYVVKSHNEICGITIFKDTFVTYNGKSTLECIFTFNHTIHIPLFIDIFIEILINVRDTDDVYYVTIDELCDSIDITNKLQSYSNDVCISAYFLYNYASYSKSPRECAIIC